MQIQQGLVHILLQLQSTLHGLQSTTPLIPFWLKLNKRETEIKMNKNRDKIN
uniref:Uncharacterized protein n=1 Tax=Anguilla anguilla TaxID=7936 RepID=A0A0E9RWP1_ANGAN